MAVRRTRGQHRVMVAPRSAHRFTTASERRHRRAYGRTKRKRPLNMRRKSGGSGAYIIHSGGSPSPSPIATKLATTVRVKNSDNQRWTFRIPLLHVMGDSWIEVCRLPDHQPGTSTPNFLAYSTCRRWGNPVPVLNPECRIL